MLTRILDFVGILLIATGLCGIENEPFIIPLGLMIAGGVIIKLTSGGKEYGKDE